MSYQNRMRQMQAASELEQQNANDKDIVDLITENEMLKRQLNLINATNQKENIKQSGRSPKSSNREKIKSKTTPKRKGGCLKMKRV